MSAQQDARRIIRGARQGGDDVAGLAADGLTGIVLTHLKTHLLKRPPGENRHVSFLARRAVDPEQIQKARQEPFPVDQ
jgi:hypothetical protein